MVQRRIARFERRAVLGALALAAVVALPGCTDEQFRELMLTLAFTVVVFAVATICVTVVNLAVLGGGIATLAINLLGTPTHRTRIYGFVFGGLNVATGITGTFGALAAMFVFHAELTRLLTPETTGADQVAAGPAPDVFVAGIVSLAMSALSLGLGVAGIAIAARAKPVDGPGAAGSSASPPPT